MRALVEASSFNSIGAGQTATLNLPTGNIIYHWLLLQYKTNANQATTEADITAIRLVIDGKVQRRCSAAELIAINAYRNRPFNAGFLPIYLSEPWRRAAAGEDSLAWATGDVSTFNVEVDIAGGAVAPTLSARVLRELGRRPMGAIAKWRRHNVPIAATGVHTINTLPMRDGYTALHAFSSDIDMVDVSLNQAEVWNATKAQADAFLEDNERSPQASVYHVDFAPGGRIADILQTARDDGSPVGEFRIDFDMTAAKAFNMITESIGPRD